MNIFLSAVFKGIRRKWNKNYKKDYCLNFFQEKATYQWIMTCCTAASMLSWQPFLLYCLSWIIWRSSPIWTFSLTGLFFKKKFLKSEINLFRKINRWNNILECLIITTKTDLQIKTIQRFSPHKNYVLQRLCQIHRHFERFPHNQDEDRQQGRVFVKCVKIYH